MCACSSPSASPQRASRGLWLLCSHMLPQLPGLPPPWPLPQTKLPYPASQPASHAGAPAAAGAGAAGGGVAVAAGSGRPPAIAGASTDGYQDGQEVADEAGGRGSSRSSACGVARQTDISEELVFPVATVEASSAAPAGAGAAPCRASMHPSVAASAGNVTSPLVDAAVEDFAIKPSQDKGPLTADLSAASIETPAAAAAGGGGGGGHGDGADASERMALLDTWPGLPFTCPPALAWSCQSSIGVLPPSGASPAAAAASARVLGGRLEISALVEPLLPESTEDEQVAAMVRSEGKGATCGSYGVLIPGIRISNPWVLYFV